MIVLVWVYYSSQLFFLGAEFTKIYTEKFGSHLAEKLELHAPKPESVIVDPKEVAQPSNERARIVQ